MKTYITIIVLSFLAFTVNAQLVKGEYFFDSEPGVGNGTEFSFTAADTIDQNFIFPITGLSAGMHTLWVRFHDGNQWGLYRGQNFYVKQLEEIDPKPPIVAMEYFYDTDPGVGNGTPYNIADADTIVLDTIIDFSGLDYGVHYFYVRAIDAAGTWSIAQRDTFEIISLPLVFDVVGTNPTCVDSCDGTASVDFTTGNPPYSYFWSNLSTEATISGLCPGEYFVTVTDFLDSITSGSVVITDPELLEFSSNVIDSRCGEANGEIEIVATGGTYNYFYEWSNNDSTAVIDSLAAASYACTVTDENGCFAAANINVPGHSNPIIMINASSDISCFGQCDGTASVVIYGGTSPFSYQWDDAQQQNTAIVSELCAGDFNVTVADSYQCLAYTNVSISEPPEMVIEMSSTDADCGAPNGGASVNVSGGTPPYSYIWSTGHNGTAISGVVAGIYTVAVTDNPGCEGFGSATISDIGGPVITLSGITDVTCNADADGEIDINVSGTGIPFSYAWNNGDETEDIMDLTAGTYQVVVTDVNECLATAEYSVVEPDPINFSFSTVDASCGGVDGAATVAVYGGSVPYNYIWSTGGGSPTITGLQSGIYTVTILDGHFCTSEANVAVGEQDAPTIVVYSVTDANCGGTSGAIDISVYGGVSPYQFNWSNGETTEDLAAIPADIYYLTVTGDDGCQSLITEEVLLVQPDMNPICMVTVDHLVGKNKIVWEKAISAGIESYNIHKLSGSDYVLIGNVLYDDMSEFIDFGSQPSSHADRYKISVLDTCGAESELSPYHQTINLGISPGVPATTMVLDWTDYVDESGSFVPSWYYIYRGTGQGSLALYDSISAAFTEINDLNVYDAYFYAIAVEKISDCIPTSTDKAQGGPYSQSYSNMDDNAIYVGISQLNKQGSISIYPNPFDRSTTIEFSNPSQSTYTLIVTDITGKIVKQQTNITGSSITLNRDDLSSGYYTVELSCRAGKEGENSFRGKIIVE